MCILGTSSEPAQLVPTPGGGASGCLPLSCPIRTGPRRRQCREGVMSRYAPTSRGSWMWIASGAF